MSPTLPSRPSLEHLKKQAKQLLGAQRHGVAQSCSFLRRLHRFADATDEEILSAQVTLAETQLVVAMHYGFASWSALREEVRTRPTGDVNSLDAVVDRSREEIPEYAGSGVPLAVVAALNHAGVEIDFMEFAAASGWAFSFGYHYEDVSPAHMAVRGDPQSDGPMEVFAFLPHEFGFEYEMALTQDPDPLWSFVKERVEAGTPIMSEHMDGGIITSCREQDGRRQLFFDGTVMPGWIDVDKLQPYGVYTLVRRREAPPDERVLRSALERAVAKGKAHTWKGIPQGAAALQDYRDDVADATKLFSATEEWFCWAAFERLMARRCCEVWLRSTAEHLDARARELTLAAAERYGEAFGCYDRYRSLVHGGEPTPLSLQERARTPERIAIIVDVLDQGIAAEAKGLSALEQVVATLG
jgi:hypothetical protein